MNRISVPWPQTPAGQGTGLGETSPLQGEVYLRLPHDLSNSSSEEFRQMRSRRLEGEGSRWPRAEQQIVVKVIAKCSKKRHAQLRSD